MGQKLSNSRFDYGFYVYIGWLVCLRLIARIVLFYITAAQNIGGLALHSTTPAWLLALQLLQCLKPAKLAHAVCTHKFVVVKRKAAYLQRGGRRNK